MLDDEPSGRFDRLDVWLMVVLVVAALGLRTFRLAEPVQMHFDEVYHARTGTEFLQNWRYGIPHNIYEYTHPHLAKYVMAGGLVVLGDDRVSARSNIGSPVRDAVVESRYVAPGLPDARAGDRVYVATGAEVRAYDLETRQLVVALPAPGARSVAVDPSRHRLFVGTDDGSILQLEDTSTTLDVRRTPSGPTDPPPAELIGFGEAGGPVARLFATDDGSAVIAGLVDGSVVSLDGETGAEVGRTEVAGLTDIAAAGTADVLVARPTEVADATAAAGTLAELLGGEAATYEERLARLEADEVVIGAADEDETTAVEAAIADGRLAGFEFVARPRVAISGGSGLTFIATSSGDEIDDLELPGGAYGLSHVTGIDNPKLYVSGGSATDDGPVVTVVDLGEAGGADQPTAGTKIRMPGEVSRVTYDAATKMVHVLGATPDDGSPTVYVIEPNGNAVYADARLPYAPTAWANDTNTLFPSSDRQQLLVFGGGGESASVEVGKHAFAWRVPGVIAGALTVAPHLPPREDPVPASVGRGRRRHPRAARRNALRPGQDRDERRLRGPLHPCARTRSSHGSGRGGASPGSGSGWGCPSSGCCSGSPSHRNGPPPTRSAGSVMLILVRSALGRLVLIGGLFVVTTVLGYMAISVPQGATSGGNLMFLLLMIGLTLVSVVVSVLHPIAWSPDEIRFAVAAPATAGILLFLVAIPAGFAERAITIGGATVSVIALAGSLVAASLAIYGAFWAARGWDSGRSPARPDPTTRWSSSRRRRRHRPAGCGLGPRLGLPVLWMIGCLVAIPIAVYVVSYIPWTGIEGHRITDNWPPNMTGQTLLKLTEDMYRYHDELRATHAASSPWWAWPFNLKPVWFYQGGFAGNTGGSIYDAGNLVIWWLGIAAMGFVCWQAFKRRSLALALIAIAFACQWLPWARIDRALFQYHYYTPLPFVVLALAYFVAELWHGPSTRTWLLARAAATLAILGPPLLWLGKGPLCTFVARDRGERGLSGVHRQSRQPRGHRERRRACGDPRRRNHRLRLAAPPVVRRVEPRPRQRRGRSPSSPSTALVSALAATVAAPLLGEGVILSVPAFQAEAVAVLLGIPLALVAWFVFAARDPRRFAAGIVMSALAAFTVLYPNISGLALPTTIVNAYQGLLPTYLYPFQFPVNTDAAGAPAKLIDGPPAVLFGALVVTAVILAYSAWVWRIALAERDAGIGPDDGLARTGGEA